MLDLIPPRLCFGRAVVKQRICPGVESASQQIKWMCYCGSVSALELTKCKVSGPDKSLKLVQGMVKVNVVRNGIAFSVRVMLIRSTRSITGVRGVDVPDAVVEVCVICSGKTDVHLGCVRAENVGG